VRVRINRRSFFRRSGLVLGAGALTAPAAVRAAGEVTFKPGDRPRRIIHLVSDGMSMGALTCADHLARLTRGRGLTWLAQSPRPGTTNGLMNVRSLNSLVTDSAASASAWGSGSRVVNGALNMLPDGRKLRTLFELFGEAGWKRGLVTTVEVTHATPAGFAANVSNRGTSDDIARQYYERRFEVMLGGGRKFFEASTRADKRDLRGEFRDAGYALLDDRAAMLAAPLDRPWLGTFQKSHLPFTVDQRHDTKLLAAVPTLAEMTSAALRRLMRDDRFILQIEGGRVDQAAHLNDAAGTFFDQIAFDEAVDVCLEFQKAQPDTLIVVTTDHGTANPGLNGAGQDYNQSVPLLSNVSKVRSSFAEMIRQITGKVDFDGEAYKDETLVMQRQANAAQVAEIIRAGTEYKVTPRQAAKLCEFFAKRGDALYDLMNSGTAQLGQLLGNHLSVGWTSLNHTSDYVPLMAIGPGAERFHGFIQNVDVFRHYTQLAGIDYKNPEAPLMAESAPSAAAVEEVGAWV
jgi:alkaline phosphatase